MEFLASQSLVSEQMLKTWKTFSYSFVTLTSGLFNEADWCYNVQKCSDPDPNEVSCRSRFVNKCTFVSFSYIYSNLAVTVQLLETLRYLLQAGSVPPPHVFVCREMSTQAAVMIMKHISKRSESDSSKKNKNSNFKLQSETDGTNV